jgi:uncharacterized protein (UPF0305 family)
MKVSENTENKEYFESVFNTARELLIAQNENNIATILNNAETSVICECIDMDVIYHTVYIGVNVSEFVKLNIELVEKKLVTTLNTVIRNSNNWFSQVIISPNSSYYSKQKLLEKINYLKDTMISVSTGGHRIQNVEQQYQQVYNEVNLQLQNIGFENPNIYDSLWSWYNKWKNDFQHYQERRDYINEMYKKLIDSISNMENKKVVDVKVNLSGWDKIRRSIIEIEKNEKLAQNEEQFQVIGMQCRELIITLAQTVYDSEKHPSIDGTEISKTDAKRMLDSYIMVVLAGNENQELRAYVKATNNLANALTHKRTATKKEMMLCTSATLTLVNSIGILEDKI